MILIYRNPAEKFGTHGFPNVQIQNIFQFWCKLQQSLFKLFNYCYIRNKRLVFRSYLFHNFIFLLWQTNSSGKYTMYIITQMKYTGSINLFPKSIISGPYKSTYIKVIQKMPYIWIMSWEGGNINPVQTWVLN